MIGWIANAVQSAFSAVAAFLDYMAGERLRRLGRLEAEAEEQAQRRKDEAIADAIEAAPIPTDPGDVLDGLRSPDHRRH